MLGSTGGHFVVRAKAMIKEVLVKISLLFVCFVGSVLLLAHGRSIGYLSMSQMQKALIGLICVFVALFLLIVVRVGSKYRV